MRKITNIIPDIFDIQYNPRLQGEAWVYIDRGAEGVTRWVALRVGPFKVFAEYFK